MRAIYNNLKIADDLSQAGHSGETHLAYVAAADARLTLALTIDETVKRVRPDDFRGHQAKENEIKRALLPLLGNDLAEVERIFQIIKQQREY